MAATKHTVGSSVNQRCLPEAALPGTRSADLIHYGPCAASGMVFAYLRGPTQLTFKSFDR